MKWGSFDPFLTEDSFWQDRMGMPVANKEFLRALLQHGTFDSYHFFCDDFYQITQFRKMLDQHFPQSLQHRIKTSVQGLFFEEMRKDPIDIMHHGDFTTFVPYLIELRNGMGPQACFPVTGVTHALDTIKLHMSFLQLLLSRPRPYDAVVCTSLCAVQMLTKAFEHIRSTFGSLFEARLPEPPALVQIPLGIPDDMFQLQDRLQCRIHLGIRPDHLVLLCLGRFSPRRKMDLAPLLECLAWLKAHPDPSRRIPRFTLILAGAGRAGDLRLAQDMVAQLGLQQETRIEGNISLERKRQFYGAADIFISLVDNYQETFGLTILEAMAQGLPVIASDFNGYKELVTHGRTGFLIPTYVSVSQEPWEPLLGLLNFSMLRLYRAQKVAFDIEELARALTTLASLPDLRHAMGLRARARALPYQWSSVIPMYERFWIHRKQEAIKWADSGSQVEPAPPVLIPSTKAYFSHYPTYCLQPEDLIKLSQYGIERCREGFKPILYDEMSLVLNEAYLNHITLCLSRQTWQISQLIDECRKQLGESQSSILVQLDWLMKHGYIEVAKRTVKPA